MMNYTWDMEELKRDKLLYEYIKTLSDDESKDASVKRKEPIYSQLLREFYMLDQYNYMRSVCDEVANDLINKKVNVEFSMEDFIPFSIDDALTLTYDFYNEILKNKPELLKIFNTEFKNRFKQIRLEKYSNQMDSGFAMYSKKLHKSFLQFNTGDDFQDLFTVVHEYGHVLSASLVNRSMPYNPYIECESTFMELISIDYFNKYNEFKKQCDNYKIDTLGNYLFGMNALHNRFAFRDSLSYYQSDYQTYDFDKRKLTKIICEGTGCDKNEINNQLQYDIEFNMPYLCAEAFAFDFANLYRNDPEKAMDIYYNMIKFTGNYSESPSYMNKKIKKLGLNPVSSFKRF